MAAPTGFFAFAPDADALDVSPTWSRLDNVTDLAVQRIQIRRGRVDEHDKTGVGTATVNGKDTAGIVDPLNASGPFYGKLDPMKQAAICLKHPISNIWYPIFRGYFSDIDLDTDPTQTFNEFTISLVDALDILSDAEVIPGGAGLTNWSATRAYVVNNAVLNPTDNNYYICILDHTNHQPPNVTYWAALTDPPTTLNDGDSFYWGQQVDDRIKAALADAALSAGTKEWPADLMEIFSGNVTVQGTVYAPRTSILQVIQDAADAEFPGVANFYAAKDGTLIFHGRLARFFPADFGVGIVDHPIRQWDAADITSAGGDTILISSLQYTRGKTNLINAALAYPNGIRDRDIHLQFVRDQTSINTYGARSISFENLITQFGLTGLGPTIDPLTETKKFATYYVSNYKDPTTRVKQITLRPQNPTDFVGNWNMMCQVDISDVVVLSCSTGAGAFVSESFYVEGITYDIQPMTNSFPEVTLTLDLSPVAFFVDSSMF